jgi:hypothetical protein
MSLDITSFITSGLLVSFIRIQKLSEVEAEGGPFAFVVVVELALLHRLTLVDYSTSKAMLVHNMENSLLVVYFVVPPL